MSEEPSLKVSSSSIAWFFIFIFYGVAAAYSGLHKFQLWEQVTFLRGTTPDFSNIFVQAHFLRYSLVYPIFIISDNFGVSADGVFNSFCFLMLFFIARNCVNITSFYVRKNEVLIIIIFGLFFFLLSTLMNGRIIFALYGFSYLLFSIQRWESYNLQNFGLFLRLFPALFLCSVSSGPFLLCVVTLSLWSMTSVNRQKRGMYIYFGGFLAVISPLILLFLLKNITFFGGGVYGALNMLNHGLGKIFYQLDLISLILFSLIIINICFLAAGLFRYLKGYRLLFIFIASSTFGGLFGYSTLSVGIIPLSVFLVSSSIRTISVSGSFR